MFFNGIVAIGILMKLYDTYQLYQVDTDAYIANIPSSL